MSVDGQKACQQVAAVVDVQQGQTTRDHVYAIILRPDGPRRHKYLVTSDHE